MMSATGLVGTLERRCSSLPDDASDGDDRQFGMHWSISRVASGAAGAGCVKRCCCVRCCCFLGDDGRVSGDLIGTRISRRIGTFVLARFVSGRIVAKDSETADRA